jgi:hypothetical protein
MDLTACEAFPYGQVEDYTVKLALVLLTLLLQQLQHLSLEQHKRRQIYPGPHPLTM